MRCRLLLSDIPAHRAIAAAANATYVNPDTVEEIAAALKTIFQERVDGLASADGLDDFLASRSAAAISNRYIRFFESVIGKGAD